MKNLLAALILMLVTTQTFSIDASLAPGLSLKNAMLYTAVLALIASRVVSGRFKVELIGLQFCFGFLFIYSLLSWLVVSFALRFPGYEILQSAMYLKIDIVDHALMFLVFFYGLQTLEEVSAVTTAMLVGVFAANVITVLDASGVLGWQVIPVRTWDESEYGRVQGAFGEANEHAAIVAMVLPAFIARAFAGHGVTRWAWWAAVAFAIAAVFMTASRGAMVGIVAASVVGAWVFRRYLSIGRLLAWVVGAAGVILLVLVALSDRYTALLAERIVGLTLSGNVTDASSGRTEIWAALLSRMMESPWSFFTGFGWNTYPYMNFDYAPHNTYLGMWFNLGLPGLIAYLGVWASIFLVVGQAAHQSPPSSRPMFVAFWIGLMALCVSIFFVQLTTPWLYVWCFAGLMARAAVVSLGYRDLTQPAASQSGALAGATRVAPGAERGAQSKVRIARIGQRSSLKR